MTIATVSAKGWVVIPKEIRQKYGIKKGDRVNFIDWGDTIYLFPVPDDPISAGLGMFKDGPSLTQALLEERRWEKERENEKLRRWGIDPAKFE